MFANELVFGAISAKMISAIAFSGKYVDVYIHFLYCFKDMSTLVTIENPLNVLK